MFGLFVFLKRYAQAAQRPGCVRAEDAVVSEVVARLYREECVCVWERPEPKEQQACSV